MINKYTTFLIYEKAATDKLITDLKNEFEKDVENILNKMLKDDLKVEESKSDDGKHENLHHIQDVIDSIKKKNADEKLDIIGKEIPKFAALIKSYLKKGLTAAIIASILSSSLQSCVSMKNPNAAALQCPGGSCKAKSKKAKSKKVKTSNNFNFKKSFNENVEDDINNWINTNSTNKPKNDNNLVSMISEIEKTHNVIINSLESYLFDNNSKKTLSRDIKLEITKEVKSIKKYNNYDVDIKSVTFSNNATIILSNLIERYVNSYNKLCFNFYEKYITTIYNNLDTFSKAEVKNKIDDMNFIFYKNSDKFNANLQPYKVISRFLSEKGSVDIPEQLIENYNKYISTGSLYKIIDFKKVYADFKNNRLCKLEIEYDEAILDLPDLDNYFI